MESLGVAGMDGGVMVSAEARMAPRQEKLDALLGKEVPVSKRTQHLVAEEELGLVRIDVGNGMQFVVAVPDSSGNNGMDVGVPLQR